MFANYIQNFLSGAPIHINNRLGNTLAKFPFVGPCTSFVPVALFSKKKISPLLDPVSKDTPLFNSFGGQNPFLNNLSDERVSRLKNTFFSSS